MSKEYSVKILIFNKSVLLVFLPLLIIGCFIFSNIRSVHSQDRDNDRQAPLHIISDRMIATKENSMVEFVGHVKATQADSVVTAESIKIFFSEDAQKNTPPENKNPENKNQENSPQGNIKQIVSTGNVEYTSGERKAFADKAVYTSADGTLILTGNSPKLVTGTSFVTGKKITLFRNQDKVLVESDGSKRVEALFNPEDNPTEKP